MKNQLASIAYLCRPCIIRCPRIALSGEDDAIHHTIAIFKKHGMESVAYWHPMDDPDKKDTLIYIIRHKSADAAKASWDAFKVDPDWKKVAKESQVDGRILAKRPDAVYMKATSWSPHITK